MPRTIAVRYDPAIDAAITTYSEVVLRTEADVQRWYDEVAAQFRRIGRRLDVLISLDGLMVKPAASRAYGEKRAAIIDEFCARTYRFGGDVNTRTSVFTTAVLTGAHANVFPTFEAALAALKADRARRA